MMKIYRTDFYKRFECTASDCKEHCCGGWRVLLDADALRRFRAEKGLTGLKLRLAMRGADSPVRGLFGVGVKGDGAVAFSKYHSECMFHDRTGLCALQLEKGHDYLPLTCRVFPRRRRLYGPFAEEHLDLSCVEAARLFLEKASGKARVNGNAAAGGGEGNGPAGSGWLQAYDEDISYSRYGNNENEAFLYGLFDARENLIRRLASVKDRDTMEGALRDIVAQCEAWQERCASGSENPFADGLTEACPAIADADDTNRVIPEPDGVCRYLPMPIGLINQMINRFLYDDDKRGRNRFLNRLCRLYFKAFDDLDERSGQKKSEQLVSKHIARHSVPKYRDYLIYHLYRQFLEVYEDYSFLRKIHVGITCMNIILLFDALWEEAYGPLSAEDEARIIAVFEKRVYHNNRMEAELYRLIDANRYDAFSRLSS
ncbi:MAG: flagellin lysine-N-methylase [Lachnospiraceae bacterium]|nr:flagellin lysine-N-methylase [Lachnospiraceae bacterium]